MNDKIEQLKDRILDIYKKRGLCKEIDFLQKRLEDLEDE